MSLDHVDFAEDWEEMISEEGAAVVLEVRTPGAGSTDWKPTDGTTEEHSAKAVFVELTSFANKWFPGTTIKSEHRVAFLTNPGVAPTKGKDRLIRGSNRYTVLDWTDVKPGETLIGYIVLLGS